MHMDPDAYFEEIDGRRPWQRSPYRYRTVTATRGSANREASPPGSPVRPASLSASALASRLGPAFALTAPLPDQVGPPDALTTPVVFPHLAPASVRPRVATIAALEATRLGDFSVQVAHTVATHIHRYREYDVRAMSSSLCVFAFQTTCSVCEALLQGMTLMNRLFCGVGASRPWDARRLDGSRFPYPTYPRP